MHRLLERQIKRHLSGHIPEGCQALVDAVDAAYTKADDDHALVSRSLDIMSDELNERNAALQREKDEQALLIARLEQAHNQLLQSEKMASIGQLAAGVAHEINNPIGFVNSNMHCLQASVASLLTLATKLQELAPALPAEAREQVHALLHAHDLALLREDVTDVLRESQEGLARVKHIVQSLKDFSHPDQGVFGVADLHGGLRSTLAIVANDVRYRADVVTEWGDLPEVECILSELNQVFMNLLLNAAQAMPKERRGTIWVRTRRVGSDAVEVEIADNGSGIDAVNMGKIFDPFFTTKPVGQGTGLGLSLSYGLVQKHHGTISVESVVGQGTCFRIRLPLQQS
jgi:signal transduction histidine kinase